MNKSIWPHQVTIDCDIDGMNDRIKWLKGNLYHGGYYEPKWFINNRTFCFKDEKEYIHFLLIWQ